MINTARLRFLDICRLEVASWGPQSDGKGPQTQVHLVIDLHGPGLPLIMRLKSRRIVDELIKALESHRDEVWGRK